MASLACRPNRPCLTHITSMFGEIGIILAHEINLNFESLEILRE